MNRSRVAVVFFAAMLASAAIVLFTAGPAPPTSTPPGSFSFAVLGDAPYDPLEDWKYPLVLAEINANILVSVVHVGDTFWRPCTEERYRRGLDWLNSLRYPVIYTPGDNEWFDCWEAGSGGYRPQERLARLRQIYFADPTRSLGGRPMPVESQAGDPQHAEFVENARWRHERILFATVHLIGSRNGRKRYPARTPEDEAAATRRTQAAVAWMRESFTLAAREEAPALVLAFHGNPGFDEPEESDYREAYEPFFEALEEEIAAFGRPVLLAQGDDHNYIVDRPLLRGPSSRKLPNLTRLQVPGSPRVGWVKVIVTPGQDEMFAFEEHVLPWWKYW